LRPAFTQLCCIAQSPGTAYTGNRQSQVLMMAISVPYQASKRGDAADHAAGKDERSTPPALLAKPEERTDAPIVLKPGNDIKNAPSPGATNDQTPVTD
jgi:hypothetical protein